jgi:glucosamine--fructose-6-phosphate aminotransferase (isomerizing)
VTPGWSAAVNHGTKGRQQCRYKTVRPTPAIYRKGLRTVCGIVGYTGREAALDFLLHGLKTLEYRGYDSAGVALVAPSGITVKKSAGRLDALVAVTADLPGAEPCGIGHTRWATHGAPTDENAHPHTDCRGRIAAVHNGIIENYRALRAELTARGHVFASETDTEVIPHLLEELYHGDLWQAARDAAYRLEGAYAFLAVSADEPLTLVAVREASPLVIGLGEGANWVASDVTALLAYTRRALVLDNGESARIRPDRVEVFDRFGIPVHREVMTVNWTPEQASKGGYPHYMLKEIHEQPDAWSDCLRGRIGAGGRVDLAELGLQPEDLNGVDRIHIVAAGTAYHAGLVAQHLLERVARVPVAVEVASEFRYREPLLVPGTVVWAVSQSGETADTLASVRLARQRGLQVWAITNVVGSTLSREADRVLYTRAGPEVAVASTKAYTTQLLVMTLLTIALAAARGLPIDGGAEELLALPLLGVEWLRTDHGIPELSRELGEHRHIFYLGRGIDYALALEGQLKLKEISYIHAEAYPAGELKHGPLALIEDGVPVIAVVSAPDLLAKTRSNLEEVRARGARVVAVAAATVAEDLQDVADRVIAVPARNPLVMAPLMALPLQLIAYHTAVVRNLDVDRPRNLAKSVTVE